MRARLLFYGGLAVLLGGFALIPSVNAMADNWPATLGPLAILLGYLLIGLSIIAAPEDEKSAAEGDTACRR